MEAVSSKFSISIIIPTFNRAAMLPNLLSSLLAQKNQQFEIIVVDDGSTDNTSLVMNQFSDERITYIQKSNGGVSSARNLGLMHAKGAYINFFDSDDFAFPNHTELALEYFQKFPERQVFAFDYKWGDAEQKHFKTVRLPSGKAEKRIFRQNYFSTNAVFMKRELIQNLRFNEHLFISEDWEFWMKLAARTQITVVNHVTTYVVEHPERGLRTIDPDALVSQKNIFMQSLEGDNQVINNPSYHPQKLVAHFNSLIALNYALVGNKREALHFLLLSAMAYPAELVHKRTLAIIKHIGISRKRKL